MSLRFYLGSVSKNNHKKLTEMTLTDLKTKYEKTDESVITFSLLDKKIISNVFELGAYYNDSYLKNNKKPFFKNKNINQYFKNHESSIVILNQDGLKLIIENLHKEIQKSFSKMLTNVELLKQGKLDLFDQFKLIASIKSLHSEWNDHYTSMKYTPYNLDKERPLINSWRYEYAILELVILYRTFDFKKNVLVLYSY